MRYLGERWTIHQNQNPVQDRRHCEGSGGQEMVRELCKVLRTHVAQLRTHSTGRPTAGTLLVFSVQLKTSPIRKVGERDELGI